MSQGSTEETSVSGDIEIVDDDPSISFCLLSRCSGCALCQSVEVIEASERIRTLVEAIEDYELLLETARLELQHLLEQRRLACQHFWEIQIGRHLCRRCGKVQELAQR
jgi:hypothetical protein